MPNNTNEMSDSLKGINASLETFNNLAKQMEDRLSKTSEYTSDMNKDINLIEKNQTKIVKESKNLGDVLGGILEKTGKIAEFAGATFAAFNLFDTVKQAFALDQNMKNLAAHMGLGVKESKNLYKGITDVAFATGSTAEAAEEMYAGLVRARVAGNDLKDAAKTMLYFSRVTGMTEVESMQLYANLSKVGNVGAKDVQKLAVVFAKVQQSVGMTENDMSILSDSIQETTYRLSAMGKSSVEIQNMAKGTMALAAGMIKVGLSAQKATEFIDKLTDPTQLEDNIGLYSQLGISIQDAMSGAIDPKQMTDGLQAFADKVKGMGPIAGSQFAKAMGQNYNDLMKMTNGLTTEVTKAMDTTSSDKPTKEIEDLAKKQEGLQLTISKFINRINALIIGLGPTLLGLAALAITFIFPRIFKSIRKESVDTGEFIKKGVVGSMFMGIEKGWEKTSTKVKKIGTNISEDYKKRLLEGTGYATAQMSADFIAVQGTVNQLGIGKSFAKGAEDFTRWLAGSAKPASMTNDILTSMRDRQKEMLTIALRDNKIKAEILQKQRDSTASVKSDYQARLRALDVQKEQNTLTFAQLSEYRQLEKVIKECGLAEADIERRQNSILSDTELTNKHYKNMTTETLSNISIEMQKQQKLTRDKLDLAIKESNELKFESNIRDKLAIGAKERNEEINKTLSSQGKLSRMKKEDVESMMKERSANNDLLSQAETSKKLMKEKESERSKIEESLNEEIKKEQQISDIINGRGKDNNLIGSDGKLYKGFNNVLRTFTGELVAGTKANLTNFAEKVKNTASTIKESFMTGANEIRKHPIRTATSAIGGLGNLMKSIGIVTTVISLFTNMFMPIIENVKTSLGPVLDSLKSIFVPLFQTLVKAILPPVLRLLAALLPIFVGLLQFLLKVFTPMIQFLLKVVSAMVGWIPGIGDALKGVTNGVSDAVGGINDAVQNLDVKGLSDSLNGAAGTISKSDLTNQKLADQGEKQERQATIYNATGGNGFSKDVTGSNAPSTDPIETSKAKNTEVTAIATSKIADATNDGNQLSLRMTKTLDSIDTTLKNMQKSSNNRGPSNRESNSYSSFAMG